jgi:TRAP-type transport system periplasmic protein
MRRSGLHKSVRFSVFVLMVCVAFPLIGLAADITLKLGHVAPPGSLYDAAATKFAERVGANTKGKVEIKVFGSSQLGTPPEHWVQVKTGVMDFFVNEIGTAAIVEQEPKNFDVVKAPYLFESESHFHKFLGSDLLKSMLSKVEKANGIKNIGYLGDFPPRSFSTTKKKVMVPEDVKGLKLRVPPEPIFVAVYKAWGANPTPVAPKEVYTSLKSGLVDGMDQNILDLWGGKYYEIQKYYVPIDYLLSGLWCWTSTKKWEAFSEDVRVAITKSAQETDAYMKQYVAKQIGEAEKAFKEAGVEILRPDLKPWKEIAEKR